MDNGESSYRRYLNGDETALDEILCQYRLSLIFFIDRIVHDPDTAEDIAIDVFVELLLHPKRYHFKASLKTYLFMLGRSRALDRPFVYLIIDTAANLPIFMGTVLSVT